MKYYKTVLIPIEVPVGNYCWGDEKTWRICPHFSNKGGHPLYDFGYEPIRYDKKGCVPKPKKCKELSDEI